MGRGRVYHFVSHLPLTTKMVMHKNISLMRVVSRVYVMKKEKGINQIREINFLKGISGKK